jgi:hypothetical protein
VTTVAPGIESLYLIDQSIRHARKFVLLSVPISHPLHPFSLPITSPTIRILLEHAPRPAISPY